MCQNLCFDIGEGWRHRLHPVKFGKLLRTPFHGKSPVNASENRLLFQKTHCGHQFEDATSAICYTFSLDAPLLLSLWQLWMFLFHKNFRFSRRWLYLLRLSQVIIAFSVLPYLLEIILLEIIILNNNKETIIVYSYKLELFTMISYSCYWYSFF